MKQGPTETVEVLVTLALWMPNGAPKQHKPGDFAQWPTDDVERAIGSGTVRRIAGQFTQQAFGVK